MDDVTRILRGTPPGAIPGGGGPACLVHIYPTGPGMGTRYVLGDAAATLGRDADCTIRVEDDSVSRHHALIRPGPTGYSVVDLQSTNGTFVNDERVSVFQLKDGDYLRVGTGIFRFLSSSNVEAQYHEEIYRLTIIDALTGIHNKRYLVDFIGRALSCAIRYRRPLSLVMFDLDKFKSINDTMGHLCGDYTLRELAACIKGSIRKDDLFARYGGEEFAVVMPETGRDGAVAVAENIRQLVEKHGFHFEDRPFPVTISLGVTATTGEDWLTTTELIQQADDCLYEAKRQGRNRVVG